MDEVNAFETQQGVKLPLDYTSFLTQIGNGTRLGGWFQVFPLGTTDDDDGKRIPFNPAVPGGLAKPFEHGLVRWEGDAFPEEELEELRAEHLEENGDELTICRGDMMHGALPLANQGCAAWIYLAINGPHRGTVWEMSDGWMSPAPTPAQRLVNFPEWIVCETARHKGLTERLREFVDRTR